MHGLFSSTIQIILPPHGQTDIKLYMTRQHGANFYRSIFVTQPG